MHRAGRVAGRRVDADQPGEPQPQRRRAGSPGSGSGQHVHPLGRQRGAPARAARRPRSSVPQSHSSLGRRSPRGPGSRRSATVGAVLDELLPARGDQAERLAGGDHDVHLGAAEPRRRPGAACSALAAAKNSWLTTAVPVPGVDVLDQPVPGALGAAGRAGRGSGPRGPRRWPTGARGRLRPGSSTPCRAQLVARCPRAGSAGTSCRSWAGRRGRRPCVATSALTGPGSTSPAASADPLPRRAAPPAAAAPGRRR